MEEGQVDAYDADALLYSLSRRMRAGLDSRCSEPTVIPPIDEFLNVINQRNQRLEHISKRRISMNNK